jgi:ribosome biogenesis GTPase
MNDSGVGDGFDARSWVAKKKKVRVQFRKNRQKRTRANDLTRSFRQGDAAGTDGVSNERVRAKGDLSRHRTVIQEEPSPESVEGLDQAPGNSLAVDLTTCQPGRVLRVHGLVSIVQGDDNKVYRCGVRRILKTLAIDGRNVIAAGDRIWFRITGTLEGQIEKIDSRKGTLTRGYRRREHVIVSNVDQLLIVSALQEPGLKLPLVDRYLIACEKGGIRPVIVLNKADLVDMAPYQWIIGLYSQLGYETIVTSAADGRGIARLAETLARGVTAFSGQSGVGKSSLLNAIQPGLNLRVREVSGWTTKGKHTTTTAELIRMENGGYVVDTPGLRQFELWDIEPAEVEAYFVEFRPYIPTCKFPDCSHTHESECSVKDALFRGQIDQGRYESYLKLYSQQPVELDD